MRHHHVEGVLVLRTHFGVLFLYHLQLVQVVTHAVADRRDVRLIVQGRENHKVPVALAGVWNVALHATIHKQLWLSQVLGVFDLGPGYFAVDFNLDEVTARGLYVRLHDRANVQVPALERREDQRKLLVYVARERLNVRLLH